MKKYDSYKDSGTVWIGEIPNCWKIKRFSYSFDIKKGKLPKILIDEPTNSALPYLSMEVLRGGHPKEFIVDNDGVKVGEGDIGLLWDGSNSGEVIKIMRKGILSSTVSLISIKDPGINKEFSFYLLKFLEVDFKNNTIGMGIPHVDGNHIRESKIILPSLAEQQQIVTFLDSKTSQIDELIQKKQRKIELLKEYRTALINKIVTKGLYPNVEMKDSGVEWIGEIPSHWIPTPLKRLVKICNGKDYKHIEVEDGGYPVYGTGGVFSKCSEYLHTGPSVLLGRKGTIGNPLFVNEPFWTSDTIYYTIIDETKIIPTLLFRLVHQIPFDLFSYGSAIPSMTKSDYEKMKFPLPPISEQRQIVSYLDEQTEKIDSSIQLEKKKIKLLIEYRQSLISEVVTGKRKVVD